MNFLHVFRWLYTATVNFTDNQAMNNFIDLLSLRCSRPHEPVTASSSTDGGMTLRLPPMVNLGVILELGKQEGVDWSISINASKTQSSNSMYAARNSCYQQLKPVVCFNADTQTAVEEWCKAQPANVSTTSRTSGPCTIIEFTGVGTFTSKAIAEVVMLPEVVTVWATPKSIQVWLAVRNQTSGGLFHLVTTGQIKHLSTKTRRGLHKRRMKKPRSRQVRLRRESSRSFKDRTLS